MKWKKDVRLEKEEGTWLVLKDRRLRIPEEDLPIINLMEKGITEESDMARLISESEGYDEIAAGFQLAQFVEDYGFFLEEGVKNRIFET